jgi:hypothetical protein
MTDEKTTDQKKTKKRSPAYPAINLETAIVRATELEAIEHDGPVNIDVAVGHWGYTSKSSPGQRILAALKHYGLIEDVEGSGKDRMIRLSQLALDIVLDYRPSSTERSEKIRIAAMNPPIFQRLFDNGQHKIVSDQSLAFYLTRKEDFNPKAVSDLIEVWKDTFTFAKLGNNVILSEDEGEKPPENGGLKLPPPNKDQFMQPQTGYQDYTLSLGEGRDVVLRAPQIMSDDDFKFMKTWLERLKLVKAESQNEEKQEQTQNN